MTEINYGSYQLKNLGKINIILGKNGCGKSTLLKQVSKNIDLSLYGKIKYITPERGGNLIYEPGIGHNIETNSHWLSDTRYVNRLENFRQQSVAQFRNLELLFHREVEASKELRADFNYTFNHYFNKLNKLLDNVEIRRTGSIFKIYKKGTDQEINSNEISSGESELISLGIECLVFEKECDKQKPNVLFLDEPDVHLHPDLQARLCEFMCELVRNKNAIIILATHSTAILGALESFDGTHLEFMVSGQKDLNFKKISEEYRKILPIFGAHPLSNLFNQTPIFLVEGEDDERIWQQAVRTSNKKLKLYPCSTDGITNMSNYEQDVEQIILAVYDNAKAYSLRDRDESTAEINDLRIINRFVLNCRAAENLLLTEQVLNTLGLTWDELITRIDDWLLNHQTHTHYQIMLNFKKSGYDRQNFDLKEIRNDLMHLIGKPISWEIAIGKTIGKLIAANQLKTTTSTNSHDLASYLGKRLIELLIK
ncbi:TPA: AAA family ATPase [Legionella pneumophila]|uniref:AAA family ATPase n=1 Tax=Legionella pneumophila TaxID=446 RepID=UPI0007876A7B|nr:AAA family ATPase [Legionella pneumophila]HAU1190893.1 ATP-binding protein [Legionella pneumophila]HBD7101605.1 AAA family ATPase [Legionella pneumophila]HBD7170697.1 AAA family ATPase [Legionella pneumophila]HCO4738111.1 AAA family ATPase [Legionella pneumophila]HEG4428820.1 AAA family ATPase [Legionella pneumophila]